MLHDAGEAEERRPEVEGRAGVVLADEHVRAGDAGEQRNERRLDGDDDAAGRGGV